MRRALIAGASGLVGSHSLALLLEDPEWGEVISLVRRPSGAANARLREVVVDFSRLPEEPRDRIDSVFVCTGTTLKKAGSLTAQRRIDVDLVVAVARWGLAREAHHLSVVSSLGADPRSPSAYLRMKAEMESEIQELGYPAVDIFQPSLLLGPREESRPVERLSQQLFTWLDPVINALLPRYRAIAAEKVARAMVTLAIDPEPGVHTHPSDAIPRLGQP
jgi:uncharacterized protein YbjT (DUF2867 family)